MIYNNLKKSTYLIIFIWGIFIIDALLPMVNFKQYGLIPRTKLGLIGIFSSPFIHGNFAHLLSNSISLFILSFFLISFYKDFFWKVFFIIMLITGIFVWIIGRNGSHIGISGVVYGLITFLAISGWLHKQFGKIFISLLITFLYGGTLLSGILPINQWISWEEHLFGAISGIVVSIYIKYEKEEEKK